ncbi:hypothetical protein [Leptothrix discophora]|uniref:HDOD domain-containing protein n=1 Tax=Leptothrix discophora TaxID=89 RepID=A0ABT9G3E0_LEPDI|nr:hypothetical protein [Leptothrix discophora]MDP4301000.1 hypothetical protein [Leptothrix discophora]
MPVLPAAPAQGEFDAALLPEPATLPPAAGVNPGATAASPNHSPVAIQMPHVSVRTVKVVNSLGHEVALHVLPLARETLLPPTPAAWITGLCDLVFSVGLRNLCEGHPFFIDVSEELLAGPLVELLDPSWAIVQLPAQVRPTPSLLDRLDDLRARGFTFSLPCIGQPSARVLALIDHVQWIQIDIAASDRSALLALWPDIADRRVYLRGIDRLDAFREYRALGVHAYSGTLLSRPASTSREQLPPCSLLRIDQLRNLLATDATDADLAELAAQDPALVLRLMILACDGLNGRAHRPDSILDLVRVLRGRFLSNWLDGLALEARLRIVRSPAGWAEGAMHLSCFMQLLAERLAPAYPDLHRQAALLGLVAHFRLTLPERMAGGTAMPLMSHALEDAWIRRQCLLGAVLDIGQRLMSGGEQAAPATAIADLFEEVGQWVVDREITLPAASAGIDPRSAATRRRAERR